MELRLNMPNFKLLSFHFQSRKYKYAKHRTDKSTPPITQRKPKANKGDEEVLKNLQLFVFGVESNQLPLS